MRYSIVKSNKLFPEKLLKCAFIISIFRKQLVLQQCLDKLGSQFRRSKEPLVAPKLRVCLLFLFKHAQGITKARQANFICIAHFKHKVIQGSTNTKSNFFQQK